MEVALASRLSNPPAVACGCCMGMCPPFVSRTLSLGDAMMQTGETALTQAASDGHVRVVQLLLDRIQAGAQVSSAASRCCWTAVAKDTFDVSPFSAACDL